MTRPKSAPPATRARKTTTAKTASAKTASAKAVSAKTASAKATSAKATAVAQRQAAPKRSPKDPGARKRAARKAAAAESGLLALIRASLDDDKAEDIVVIDLGGRSSLTDTLVIASGRSSRHVTATAEHLVRRLKEAGYGTRPTDGLTQGDWVLVDAGDVIVHLFRPEVRQYYDLEGMWRVPEPERAAQ